MPIPPPKRAGVRSPGLMLAAAVLALVACDSVKPTQDRQKELTLYEFAGDMRWGDFDAAYDLVDPVTKKEHPITDLERERFKQVEVSGYDVIGHVDGKDKIDQQVKLDLINKNTQLPRSIVYHEHWRWDPAIKHWWLESGLPDISPQP